MICQFIVAIHVRINYIVVIGIELLSVFFDSARGTVQYVRVLECRRLPKLPYM